MKRRTRFINNTIYSLKRRYGGKVTFHRDSETLNTETGKKVVVKQVWKFKKAIVLPYDQSQRFSYDLSYIASNKNFTYGAIFDTSMRRVILDSRDTGEYEPQQRDYFTMDNRRWDVIDVRKFEFDTGYMVTGQEVTGAPTREVHEEKARNRAIFSQEVSL